MIAALMLVLAAAPGGFEQRILDIHNRERALVQARPLEWDARLARDAAAWAERMTGTAMLRHAGGESGSGQGENLWMGTRGRFSVETMVGDWAGEKASLGGANLDSEAAMDAAGHYTQMVWRGTRRVGCAVASDAQWDYFVCRYDPPGNEISSGW